MSMRHRWTLLLVIFAIPLGLLAQDDTQLSPVTRSYAITNVNIIQGPGRKIDMGTILIKDGLITAVGKGIAIPAGAIVIKADSMYAYAGFIDGLTRAGVNKPKEESKEKIKDPGNPPPDRAGINPQMDVRNMLNPSDKALEEMRALGFTTAQVVPFGNFLPGQAAIVLTGASSPESMVITSKSALYSELSGANGIYPATVLGVMAKWRDLYRNASLSKSYEGLYASNRSGLERPADDRILQAFYPVIDQREPVLFKSEHLLDAYRILTLKNELSFQLTLADLKDGWPMISKLKASGAKVFLSLDLPEEVKKDDKKKDDKAPKLSAAAAAEKEALDKRKAEAIANYAAQASSFQKAGVMFGFSGMSAKSKDIPANLRRMIAAGLSEDATLAALTTTPAQLLGLSDRMGTIDNGKMANIVISDKSYFNEKAKVRYVFVDGMMYKMEVKDTKKTDGGKTAEIEGTWSTTTDSPQGKSESKLTIKKDGSNYTATISGGMLPAPVDAKDVTLDGTTLTYNYTLNFGGNAIKVEVELTVDGTTLKGTSSVAKMGSFPTEGTKDPKN